MTPLSILALSYWTTTSNITIAALQLSIDGFITDAVLDAAIIRFLEGLTLCGVDNM